jgi:hypothetical protein
MVLAENAGVTVEIVILLAVGVCALGAFVTGIGLLVLYVRAGRQVDELPAPPPRQVVACPRCGAMNPPGVPVCGRCGLALGSSAPQYPPGPAPVLPPAAPPRTASRPSPAPLMIQGPALRQPDVPRAWLEGVGGALAGQRAWLDKPDTLVGRSTVCDIQVFDPKVSRKHFLVRFGRGAFYLQDQRSSHGTLINGERVRAQRLRNGDRITIGDTTLIFHVES